MYHGLSIKPPFFEVGPKAFLFGKAILDLAIFADELSEKYDIQIVFTPQYVDIPILARETKNILVFAQHMDSLEVGRGIGSVLPEALKSAGADGVLLNHVERRLTLDEIERVIKRADEVGLISMVCADTIDDAVNIARFEPNIIIAESPTLIGVGKRDANDQIEISRINDAVWGVNPEILVLHGAGISNGKDVFDVISAGAQGTGSTSGIFLAENPFEMLEEMIMSVRTAWDKTNKSQEK